MLYSLIRREKPQNIVELGTGLGVCTVWMARGAKENGFGHVFTVDDARDETLALNYLNQVSDRLPVELRLGMAASYADYLSTLSQTCGLSNYITYCQATLAVGTNDLLAPGIYPFQEGGIDLLLADFAHGPEAIMDILAYFLPLMSECASIFIDSASTHLPSFLVLERVIQQLNQSKMPQRFLAVTSRQRRWDLFEIVTQRTFRLMHLIERRDRPQNSTAWIRIEPTDWIPHPLSMLH